MSKSDVAFFWLNGKKVVVRASESSRGTYMYDEC